MPFDTGTATDKINLLDKLRDFITSQHVATAAVSNGGTGYTAGDILTASGGTFFTAATFEVLTVSSGVITALRIVKNGAYTSNPSSPVNTTGGTGTGATVTVTFASTGWTVQRESQEALSATVQAGGTGYAVNDILTVVGGTFTTAGQFKVTAVSGGVVTTVTLQTKGSYQIIPANPVTTTGGGGTGCTLNVTWQAQNQAGVEKEMIFKGVGSGSDEIYVGIRTYVMSSNHLWELAGMTGYQAASTFSTQPGISGGRHNLTEDGHYVPLANSTITYFFFVNGRRIICVFKIGTTYTSMYLGWLDPFATPAEYPYPMMVNAGNSDPTRLFSSTAISNSGIVDPIGHVSNPVNGPCSIRDPGGNWRQFRNGDQSGSARNEENEAVLYPAGEPDRTTGVLAVDQGASGTHQQSDFIPNVGVPGTQTYNLWPTPHTPSNISPLWPVMAIECVPDRMVMGEMSDTYWVSAQGESTNLVAEDQVTVGNDVYLVFPQANRTDIWAHFAVKRA